MTIYYRQLATAQVHNRNNDQSNIAKGGIAPHFYLPGDIINLQFNVLARGLTPNLPFPYGLGTPI